MDLANLTPKRLAMMASSAFLAVLLVGVGSFCFLRSKSDSLACPKGQADERAELQKALDKTLSTRKRWVRASDGSWRVGELAPRAAGQDLYRVEDRSGTAFIVWRANGQSPGVDESNWLILDSWCSADEFLDDAGPPPLATAPGPTVSTSTTSQQAVSGG
jgi:hypothetical protein